MPISEYKEITIPEGNVKMIQDVSGKIIWGSQSSFPYRRLEYIDIPKQAYINFNTGNNNNTTGVLLDVNFNLNNDTISSTNNANQPFGSIYRPTTTSGTYYRYHITITANTNNVAAWYGSSGQYTSKSSIANGRHKYEMNIHTYRDGKLYIDDVEEGTFAPSSTGSGTLQLGARRFNTAGTITINNYTSAVIRCWSVITQEQYGNENQSKYYPVQRKSDGKVGLLKIYKDGQAVRFCVSETSTECIAGPVVDEYFEGNRWV